MLILKIDNYRGKALGFKDTYKQNLLDARDEKQTELGIFYELLSDNFIDKLLLYTPKQQYKLISIILRKYPILEDKSSDEHKAFRYIFIDKGYDQIDKKEFYNQLGINSCVYCNRNYIFNLDENGHIKGQIDHFYDKASYPYLAMSFYNLIPSCAGCNKVKSSYNTYTNNSISPYMREESKIFDVEIDSVDNLKYKLQYDDLLDKLHIEKIYNGGHTDILNDMYEKFYQSETKEHFKLLKKEFQNLGISDSEIHRYLTCGYFDKEDFHKRTFSKLTKDISQELGLL
jgi:hypothetical protein